MRSPFCPVPALVLAIPLMLGGPALAAVFKCKAPDGATIFQDSECGPGSQPLQAPKAGNSPPVDLTQPLDKRFKTPEERDRLMAALKIAGLDLGMHKGIEFCKTEYPKEYPELFGTACERIVEPSASAVASQP